MFSLRNEKKIIFALSLGPPLICSSEDNYSDYLGAPIFFNFNDKKFLPCGLT